ncbi:TolB-like translocation protein [Athalassotoga saccharophila]|uniref:hypothetical protein n=1 Tax=Athalassotoga saccharophila TaxID=1441386 RepID=UPI00137B0B66|nr:hypothetical protein [Athalassotoga saccharophila]BBJ27963.1 hypothetical protein ATHSA_0858 [Athalassotoga saccharophila]
MKGLGWLAGLLFIPFVVFGAMNPFLPIYANPYTSYEVISTPYLNVVYQPGCEYAVNEFLKYADTVYQQLTDFYDVEPYSKLTVVIQNDTDIVNSVTDPVDNVIFIFLNSSADQTFSPSVSSWVRFVFTHELTHILITQKGGLNFLRVYGVPLSTAYNGLMIPSYFQEGLAEYTETYFNDNRGRLNDPIFEMYLREYVLSGNLKGLGGSINYESDGWDPEGAPYLVGGSFIRYIGQTYGATAIKKIVSNFSQSPSDGIPSAISKTLNKNFSQIISEWISAQKQDVDDQVKNVGQVLDGIQLTHSGRWTGIMNGYGNGKLYYYYEDTSSIPSIRVMNTTDMNSHTFYNLGGFIYDNGYIQSLSVSPDGKNVAFTRIIPQNGGNFDYDHLFILNSNGLINTHLKNVLMTAWISNDNIAYVEENGGLYSIKSFNLKDGSVKILLSPSYVVITSISAYNGNVYFSGSYKGKDEIYEIDTNGSVYGIVSGDYLMRDMTFSQNGNYMIFSAAKPDKDGIFNLYAVSLQNGQFYKITNVIGGSFSPQVDGNKLFYAGYTQNGYNLFVIDGWKDKLTSANGFSLVKVQVDLSVDLSSIFAKIQNDSKPYNDSLKPIMAGTIPVITSQGTSINSLVYSMGVFGVLRDTLGFNTVYTSGNISSSATYDYLTLGLAHYGRLSVNAGLTLSPSAFSIYSSAGIPFTGLIFERDFLFYPSIYFTYESSTTNVNNFGMNMIFLWNPSSIPNNSSAILPFYMNGQLEFFGTKLTAYSLNLYTSFPFVGNVMGMGINFLNGNLAFSQSINLSRIYVNLYDVTGEFGLRYVDLSQFSSYDLGGNEPIVGLSAVVGIDSLFNQTVPVQIYGSYDFKTAKFEYGVNLEM